MHTFRNIAGRNIAWLSVAAIALTPMAPAQPGIVAGGIALDRPDPVKGAPYSAEAIYEITSTGPDGPQVIRTITRVYRDSQGRERRDESLDPATGRSLNPNPTVQISDPIARANYVLSPLQHSAMRIPMPGSAGIGNPRPGAGMLQPTIQFTPTPGPAGAGAQTPQIVTQQGDHLEVTGTPALRTPAPPSPRVERLEPQTIEGLRAEGSRTVEPIPAVGASAAAEVVSENWTSPDLKVTLMSRRTDPRGLETLYRLTHISREEPDPSLFEVPSGYSVQEMPSISGGMVTGGVSVGVQPRQ